MAAPLRTWFVIADGAGARIVARRPGAATYDTVGRVPPPLSHRFSHEIGSDAPGRAHESATVVRHALQPRHDLHRLEKESFARRVAIPASVVTLTLVSHERLFRGFRLRTLSR
jgi:hypothetical protein